MDDCQPLPCEQRLNLSLEVFVLLTAVDLLLFLHPPLNNRVVVVVAVVAVVAVVVVYLHKQTTSWSAGIADYEL